MKRKLNSTDPILIDLYGDIDSTFTDAQNKLIFTKYMVLKELYEQCINSNTNKLVSEFLLERIKKVEDDFYINANSAQLKEKIISHFHKKN